MNSRIKQRARHAALTILTGLTLAATVITTNAIVQEQNRPKIGPLATSCDAIELPAPCLRPDDWGMWSIFLVGLGAGLLLAVVFAAEAYSHGVHNGRAERRLQLLGTYRTREEQEQLRQEWLASQQGKQYEESGPKFSCLRCDQLEMGLTPTVPKHHRDCVHRADTASVE